MWHTFTIVEILLVVLETLFAENSSGLVKFRSVLKVNKCFLLLKDNNITLHMIAYMRFCSLCYENSNACFPNFGAARTPYLMYDVYTNDSKHGLCFPTLNIFRRKFSPIPDALWAGSQSDTYLEIMELALFS